MGGRSPKDLSHHLLPSRVHISRKLDQNSQDLNPLMPARSLGIPHRLFLCILEFDAHRGWMEDMEVKWGCLTKATWVTCKSSVLTLKSDPPSNFALFSFQLCPPSYLLQFFLFFFSNMYFTLKVRDKEKRERQREVSFICWFTPQMVITVRAGLF